jgi:hypothetical protein
MLKTSAKGNIERIVSSKRSVKSKPLRHFGPAHGPNVLSTGAQSRTNSDAIVMIENQPVVEIAGAFSREMMGTTSSLFGIGLLQRGSSSAMIKSVSRW